MLQRPFDDDVWEFWPAHNSQLTTLVPGSRKHAAGRHHAIAVEMFRHSGHLIGFMHHFFGLVDLMHPCMASLSLRSSTARRGLDMGQPSTLKHGLAPHFSLPADNSSPRSGLPLHSQRQEKELHRLFDRIISSRIHGNGRLDLHLATVLSINDDCDACQSDGGYRTDNGVLFLFTPEWSDQQGDRVPGS